MEDGRRPTNKEGPDAYMVEIIVRRSKGTRKGEEQYLREREGGAKVLVEGRHRKADQKAAKVWRPVVETRPGTPKLVVDSM